MIITINPIDPRPIYLQIVDEVRRALILGTLLPDAPLPSVRQLAVDLRVNPNTVGQAYRELERQGLAYVRRGQGTFATHTSLNEDQRHVLAAAVAVRALQDARRNGLDAEELIQAIRASNHQSPIEEEQ
jgi:GntR family transcriptional regulator